MKLTDIEVKKLSLPPGKSDLIALDDKLTGFGFRIRGGKKRVKRTWIIVYRDAARKSQKFTLGTVEELNAAKAREVAANKLAGIRLGTYPHVERQKAHDAAIETFGAIAKHYLAARAGGKKPLRERSLEEVTRHIEKHWGPLARASIHHIDRRVVAKRIGEIATQNGPVAANRARSTLSAMFAWAIGEGIVENNPVTGTNKGLERARKRVLTDVEIFSIWKACRDDDYGRIVRLLTLTGQRRDEVGSMRSSEIDLDAATWTIPGERTKNGRAHVVPLAPSAIDVIVEAKSAPRLPRTEGAEDFVFGEGQGGYSGWSRAKERLDRRVLQTLRDIAEKRNDQALLARLLKVEDLMARIAKAKGADRKALSEQLKAIWWVLHDLRRTMDTVMGEKLGIEPHVVEAALNHVSGPSKAGVAGVYNLATYFEKRKIAHALWADHVRAIAEAGERKVIPMRPVAS